MTAAASSGVLLERVPERRVRVDRLALVLVLLLHLGATCVFFPPAQALRSEALHAVDYPVHTHRVYMYRQGLSESGLPWGYDPAISAGTVMNPGQDLGAKPQQVLGVLLPFLTPGAVVRLFLFLALLTSPLWILLACRRLGIPEDRQAWIMITALMVIWAPKNVGFLPRTLDLWHYGLASFTAAAYFSVYVLALFLDFLARPGVRTYLVLCLAAILLFFLHILGPVIIIPTLVVYTLAARSLQWRWRLALMLVPLVVLAFNAFWAVPALLAHDIPQYEGFPPRRPPWPVEPSQVVDGSVQAMRVALMFGPFFLGLGLAAYGLFVLRRTAGLRTSVALGVTGAFGLVLAFFGSSVPGVAIMQPDRFLVPALAFLTLPVGTALAMLVGRLRLPVGASAAGLTLVMALGAVLLDRPVPLALPPEPDPLAEFAARRAEPSDRLLIQSLDEHTKVIPLKLRLEVIGSNFPAVWDPPQFLREMLLGRQLHEWSPEGLREALGRWGVAWVFTVTPEAHALLAAATGHPGEEVRAYRAFRMQVPPSRFMTGAGQVAAQVNRLELTQLRPDDGLVVLRYRFHPGWQADPEIPVYQYSVPEDPAGFIALVDPPASVTLRFDPWGMLGAPWPAPERAISAGKAR